MVGGDSLLGVEFAQGRNVKPASEIFLSEINPKNLLAKTASS